MFSEFKNKRISIKITQIILFIVFVLYILESIFLRGLFTNTYLLLINTVLGIISIIFTLIKNEYKLSILDLMLTLIPIIIFIFLTNL